MPASAILIFRDERLDLAGDSFAGALTFFLANGLSLEEACRRAGAHGAAVLRGIDPLEVQTPLIARVE